MNKLLLTPILFLLSITAYSQAITRHAQAYGKIDKADLEMKSCDFEKDANAEVLLNKGITAFDYDFNITEDVHKRIKIFNDNGKKEADIHLVYYSANHLENISGIQAETFNLVDGKVEVTKLDKKLIYYKDIDKTRSEIVFTFPNVKPGSVIEYSYVWHTSSFSDFPDWYFQEKIPVRYCELTTQIPDLFNYRVNPNITSNYLRDSTSTMSRTFRSDGDVISYNLNFEQRAIANIPSMPDEPYMSSYKDNLQYLLFQLVSIRPIGSFTRYGSDTWDKVGGRLIEDEDFGGQLRKKLDKEEVIISKAKTLKTNTEKVVYIFNEVKNAMKWNGVDEWYTNDGTAKAWEKKTGNSTEINLILYHLLKQVNVPVYPMVVSTREHGKVQPFYTSLVQFNRAVVYAPIDANHTYVLDASGKYNVYNEIPSELLNSSGLYVDKAENLYNIIFLHKEIPAQQTVYVTAEIKPGGKLEGMANIISSSYNRTKTIERYKKDGEKKYIDYLRDDDNNLKISALKFENMEVDTLPLIQNVNFNLDLAGSDENYIYVNPNLFSSLKTNPFLSLNRMTDVDFAFCKSYIIGGTYKLPAGYKIDAIPKNGGIMLPDQSIVFKRLVAAQDGSISVRYTIEYKKQIYKKESYPDFYEFVKKMNEMLNEQIILKKS